VINSQLNSDRVVQLLMELQRVFPNIKTIDPRRVLLLKLSYSLCFQKHIHDTIHITSLVATQTTNGRNLEKPQHRHRKCDVVEPSLSAPRTTSEQGHAATASEAIADTDEPSLSVQGATTAPEAIADGPIPIRLRNHRGAGH